MLFVVGLALPFRLVLLRPIRLRALLPAPLGSAPLALRLPLPVYRSAIRARRATRVVPQDVLEHRLPVAQRIDRVPQRLDRECDPSTRDTCARIGFSAVSIDTGAVGHEVAYAKLVGSARLRAALRVVLVFVGAIRTGCAAVEHAAVLDEQLGEDLVLDGSGEGALLLLGLLTACGAVSEVQLALALVDPLVDEALEEVGSGEANTALLLEDKEGDLIALLVLLEQAVRVDLAHDLKRLDAHREIVLANRHVDELLLEAIGEMVQLAEVGVLLIQREEGANGFATGLLRLRARGLQSQLAAENDPREQAVLRPQRTSSESTQPM